MNEDLSGQKYKNKKKREGDCCCYVTIYTCKILKSHLEDIRNVNEWSQIACYSRSWMTFCLKVCIGETPNSILKNERFNRIKTVILNNPLATASFVASNVYKSWDEKRLYNFLARNYNTNFTKIRLEILKNEVYK